MWVDFGSPGFEPSLKLGLGAIPFSRNPVAGIRPSGDGFMHIVPPVITMRTRASGNCVTIGIKGKLFGRLEPMKLPP